MDYFSGHLFGVLAEDAVEVAFAVAIFVAEVVAVVAMAGFVAEVMVPADVADAADRSGASYPLFQVYVN